jgi:hypothetical protein
MFRMRTAILPSGRSGSRDGVESRSVYDAFDWWLAFVVLVSSGYQAGPSQPLARPFVYTTPPVSRQ